MAIVSFTSLLESFKPRHQKVVSTWIEHAVLAHHKYPISISFIFCTDDYLMDMNQKYLKHKTLTDIITFNYNENFHISGDIFISIDRVRDNAKTFDTNFDDELHRVMIHGVLHLLGYNDKSPIEQKKMRKKEDEFLAQLEF